MIGFMADVTTGLPISTIVRFGFSLPLGFAGRSDDFGVAPTHTHKRHIGTAGPREFHLLREDINGHNPRNMMTELRIMRDYVYGQRCSDNNWNNCLEFWYRDVDWLRKEYEKLPRPLPPHDSLPWPKTT